MPPWGRPPGGRPGRRNDRQRDLRRSWAYDDRVEELDTDDDISQGVELDQDYGDKRFVSDELRFTGIDLGGGAIRRRRSGGNYNDFTPSDDDEDDYDPTSTLVPRQELQIVYKEKEDMLVERALERIARARALGKADVKLSRAEIDALERLERNQHPPRPSAAPKMAAPQSKKEAPVKRKPVEVRKKASRNDTKSASNSPRRKPVDSRDRGPSISSNSSGRGERDDQIAAYQVYPIDHDYGHVGRRLPYPQGNYITGPRQAESSRQGSRTNSSQSLRQQQPSQQMQPVPPYQHPYYATRYASNPDAAYSQRPGSNSSRASRPDPSEPDWEPRARSTSSLVNVPLDQLPYQANTARAPRFDPSDPRYASPQRRVASGSPLAQQHSPVAYRRPQDELFLPNDPSDVMRYLAPSEEEEEDDDDDSDYDEGVQVDVSERPGGEYAIQTRSATASNPGNRGKNGTSKKATGKARRR